MVWYGSSTNATEETGDDFEQNQGFDSGTIPWTPVFIRTDRGRLTGRFAIEYSLDATFSSLYDPVGNVLPLGSVESGVLVASEVIDLDSVPKPLNYIAPVNTAQIELIGDDNQAVCQYSFDGDPINGAYHRIGNGQPLTVNGMSMASFLGVLATGSTAAKLHVHYFFSPNVHG